MFGCKPGPGREVTNEMVVTTLRGCAMLGVDAKPLLEVFGNEREAVLNARGRCDWNQFALFQDRVGEVLGGARGMEDMIAKVLAVHPITRTFASLVTNVRRLYVLGFERIGRSAIPHVGAYVQPLDDSSLVVETAIPQPYRGSIAFNHGTVGLLRMYPTLLGLPEAVVDAEVSSHRLLAHVTPPPSRDLGSRLKRSIALLADRVWHESAEDLPFDVFDETVIEDLERALTVGIDDANDLSALEEGVFDCLRKGWCAAWVRVEWRENGSVRRFERGGPVPAAIGARSLTVGDREVGRLLTDKPALDTVGESPLFRKVVVHTAMALDRILNTRPTSGRAALERLAASWQLTNRQHAVLQLVVRGMSNKEIASALGCSVKGIEAHMSLLLRRAAVTSRTELIARCYQ